MKSLFVALGFLIVVGCALDIPAPAPQPPASKPDYEVTSADGKEVRHYDGNGALVWIERHELSPGTSPTDPRIKTYHSSAADVLLWYEYRRFETVGSTWVKTREQRFTALGNAAKDNGTKEYAKAWSYASPALPLLMAHYGPTDNLVGYDFTWAEAAANNRVLQTSTHGASGTAQSYDRTWFDEVSGKKTAHFLLDGDLGTLSAQSFAYEADNLVETLEYNKAKTLWSREARSFLTGSTTPYRTLWYQSAANTTPATAITMASPPVAAVTAVTTPVATGSIDAAILPTPQVSLVALPALNAPTSWPLAALQGFEYVLPDLNGGTTTVRFDKNRLPTSVVRAAQGTLGAMEIDFLWDAEKRLTQRLVKYAANPVLTIDLHRDASGRIDRVDTAGSLLKRPLTYTLAYAGTATRPDTLTLSTKGQNLLTVTYTYDDKFAALAPGDGLDVLNFDAHVRTLTLGVGGGSDLVNAVTLEFPTTTPVTSPATVSVYDVVAKASEAKKLIGTLTWSFDPALHQTGLAWRLAASTKDDWTYTASWGTWAKLATGMTNTALDTGATLEADASKALALVDSFDVEKVWQLVNEASYRAQAANLFDQVKAAQP